MNLKLAASLWSSRESIFIDQRHFTVGRAAWYLEGYGAVYWSWGVAYHKDGREVNWDIKTRRQFARSTQRPPRRKRGQR